MKNNWDRQEAVEGVEFAKEIAQRMFAQLERLDPPEESCNVLDLLDATEQLEGSPELQATLSRFFRWASKTSDPLANVFGVAIAAGGIVAKLALSRGAN